MAVAVQAVVFSVVVQKSIELRRFDTQAVGKGFPQDRHDLLHPLWCDEVRSVQALHVGRPVFPRLGQGEQLGQVFR